MKNTPILFVVFALFLSYGCKNEAENKCKYKAPEAFFSEQDPSIAKHSFEQKEMKSTEIASFTNRFDLTILQSGCEALNQEYRFEIPGSFQDKTENAFWIELAAKSFSSLSNTGPKFSPLAQSLAQLIQDQAELLKLGEEQAFPQMGFSLKLDKVVSSDFGTLLVELKELGPQ